MALEAVIACCAPAAVAEADAAAQAEGAHRIALAAQLSALPGIEVHQPAAAPFLLLRVPDGPRIRAALRDRGIAVRRADTFPGLTPNHIRIAVRPPAQAAVLVDALRDILVEALV